MTIGGKLAAMEKDCMVMVADLNKTSHYREASQLQGLLQQVGNCRATLEAGDPPIADQEYPSKTTA